MTAPTRLAGDFDPLAYSSLLYDALETVPDLQPGLAATHTYAKMRRDSRLAAILAGYTLQIRGASWQVEPGGCRPEVVALVADDLGLPVAGDDNPTAARTRGVSWNNHLRSALASLTFGFTCFELLAEITDGRARLTTLAPRLPVTIHTIHTDPKTGDLLGVSQELTRPTRPGDDKPQITADRLAFYAHDPEGTVAGTSLLRSSYAPWFLKQELMRVHATSARRFGMGVPTVEWAQGSTPTPEQMRQAHQVAAAARVGEQSGASLPPGASLILRGLTGAVPDVLAYVKFLNAEMAQACLMPHLDLGTSETGSRALGTAFIDSWVLSLSAIGNELADVATRQIAARVVGWNWRDEQVPRIVSSGIGSQRDVTAESLNQLLTSGALSADPALEAWVRREYRLPEREGMAQPAPSVAGDTIAAANRRPRARAAKTKETHPGQLSLPMNVAKSNDDAIQREWQQARDGMLADWPDADDDLITELSDAAGRAAADDRLAELGTLEPTPGVRDAVIAFVTAGMTGLAATSAARAVAELAKAGHDTEAPDDPGGDRIPGAAEAHAELLISGYAAAAGAKALTLAGPAATAAAVTEVIREHLEAMSLATAGLCGGTFGAALTVAQNAARADVFDRFPHIRYVAVEKNDVNACQPCKDADGTVYADLATAREHYPLTGNASCLGGGRCRGHITPDVDD